MEIPPSRVLLIDDDEDEYAVIREMLAETGATKYDLDWAGTYNDGLKAISQSKYDVVLIDYRLGEKNGLELLNQIIGEGMKAPVILLTGQGEYRVDLEAMDAGASDYLDKGQINTDILDRSLRYSMKAKRIESELKRYRDHLQEILLERTSQKEGKREQLRSGSSLTQHSTPTTKATNQLVALEQIRLFQRNTPVSQAMTFLTACLITVVLWPAEKPLAMLVWFSLALTAIIFRIVLCWRFSQFNHSETLIRTDLWKRWTQLSTFVSGAVWGGGGVCLYPTGDAPREAFLCIFLMGMCSGALPLQSPVQGAFPLFAAAILFPMATLFTVKGGTIYLCLAFATLLQLFALIVSSDRYRLNIAESLHLRFNNDSLVRDLTVEIADRNKAEDRLKSINEDLKQTISLYNAANRELNKAQRVIHALSESNHAVIHIGDEAELLRAICRIAVDVGGYRMAWVGYAEDDRDQTVTPVARYGYEKGYLETVKVTWQDAERGEGPTGACIRTGLPSIIRSVGDQEKFAPWEVEASKQGYASVIGLPLLLDGQKLGALTIYSSETDAFDTKEVEFLVKLSSNLSYGIGVLRLRKAQIQAEESLKEANLDLGRRVEERTAELVKVNAELRRDITERKQAEEALRESETKFRSYTESAPLAILVSDRQGWLIDSNPAATDLLGYDAATLRKMRIIDLHPEEDREEVQRNFSTLLEVGHVETERRMKKRDGQLIWVSWRIVMTSDQFSLGYCQDITERKEAEEIRSQMEAQLRQAQKMEALGTLAGGVAHDFNNILGMIMGYTELAKWELDKASPVLDKLDEVLKSTNRAKALVKQILAFSRSTEQQKMPLQLRIIVNEAMRILRPSLPSTIEIKTNVLSKRAVLADPTQMHQVLMNLCTNAAHAMQEEGGILEVTLTDTMLGTEHTASEESSQPRRYVELRVRDTGHGIDPAIIHLIFDPFFTTKEKGEGTGLGLSVVHGIVKNHGGDINVRSFPGKGTTFTVHIPALETEYANLKVEAAAPLPRGRERVLVVDDEPLMAAMVQQMLARLGYDAVFHTSGIEALEAVRNQSAQKPFDLVVTDMTMPHFTGQDLASELFQLQPAVPVILMTGFSNKIDADKANALGIQGFLMKPVALEELAGTVRTVLDRERNKALFSSGDRRVT